MPAELVFIDAPYSGFEALNFLEPYIGFDGTQAPQGLLLGVPQATLSGSVPGESQSADPAEGRGLRSVPRPGRLQYQLAFSTDIEQYDVNPRDFESLNPRHRISTAGTYQLPFGKGRQYMSLANRVPDGILGGWQVLGALHWSSGDFLSFGALDVSRDPVIDNPTPKKCFDTSVFKQLTASTLRRNPRSHSGLTGPTWQPDATITKEFRVTECWKSELKMSACNATNHLNRANPDTRVNSSNFGQTLRQRGNYFGRQVELGLKIMF